MLFSYESLFSNDGNDFSSNKSNDSKIESKNNSVQQVLRNESYFGNFQEIASVSTYLSEEDTCQLPYIAAMMFATVLEDTITSLCILGECNNELRIMKTLANMNYLILNKYEIDIPYDTKKYDESSTYSQQPVHSNVMNLRKMAADKTHLGDCIREIYKDLSVNLRFEWMVSYLNKLEEEKQHFINLEQEIIKNKALHRELYKQLRSQRTVHRSAVYDYDSDISKLKFNIEDSALVSDFRKHYAIRWQKSRIEQFNHQCSEVENEAKHSIEYYKSRQCQENRAHNEVEMYNHLVMEEKLRQIEELMAKYEDDIEAIDIKIHLARNEWTNMMDQRKAIEDKIEKREQEMKDWIQFKEDRRKAELYKVTMERSAIIVQAWWRGFLVRHRLGPFRPKRHRYRIKHKT